MAFTMETTGQIAGPHHVQNADQSAERPCNRQKEQVAEDKRDHQSQTQTQKYDDFGSCDGCADLSRRTVRFALVVVHDGMGGRLGRLESWIEVPVNSLNDLAPAFRVQPRPSGLHPAPRRTDPAHS